VTLTPRIRKSEAGRTDSLPFRIDIYPLTTEGALLSGAAGHRVYRAIYSALRRLPKGAALLVEFCRVQAASSQALREILSVFDVLRSSKFEERFVVFQVDARNRDLVESLELSARFGGGVVPVIDAAGERRDFGKLTKAERDTLKAVERVGELTSRELRERLGLLPSAASNRLRRLHQLRLLRREERAVPGSGGREFVYRPLVEKRRRGGARKGPAGSAGR
jgi:hypothetical protein